MTSPRFLTLEDVAGELAISTTQTYTLVRSGEIPAIQVGPKKVWRIERAKLEEYIERQYEAARSQVADAGATVTKLRSADRSTGPSSEDIVEALHDARGQSS